MDAHREPPRAQQRITLVKGEILPINSSYTCEGGDPLASKRYAPCLLENDPPLIISLDSCSTASAPVKQSTTIRKLWGALFCSRLFQLLTAATVHLYLFYFEGNINGERWDLLSPGSILIATALSMRGKRECRNRIDVGCRWRTAK